MDVDPGTQDSGETSKAKLFTPDVPEEPKSGVPEWVNIIMIVLDFALNTQVPVAGYYLEKYLEANYSWTQN